MYDGKMIHSLTELTDKVIWDAIQRGDLKALTEAMNADYEGPKCACGSQQAVMRCRNCKGWVCDECRKDHCCGYGPEVTPFRY